MKSKTFLHLLVVGAVVLAAGLLLYGASLAAPLAKPEAPAQQISKAILDRPLAPAGQDAGIRGPFVGEAVTPAIFDGDLRDLPQLSGAAVSAGENPLRPIPGNKWPPAPPGFVDPVAQSGQGPGQMPDPIMNFEGLNKAQGGGWTPPDTNGDVGPVYYIQNVNVGLGIFVKATGALVTAMTFDTFFDGTGTPCDTQSRGDPIVVYDPLADRWLITDFSLPASGPVYECRAISQNGDPVGGGWYFYAFVTDSNGSPWHDYPKFGVWPDAYYMSANMFDPWSGAWVWAFDRAAMLNGDPMTAVRFEAGAAYGGLLPANLRGTPPPAGAPNYFASMDFPNNLNIWEFHVDWGTPANSSFNGPLNLTVADFGIISEIPQASPGTLLDSLGDRLMMQLQYRNFGSHEALWVNHTVASGGAAGVRWYEIRDPGGTPLLFQQGTFQPDDLYRWMGSLAVDQDGNMAVGYSVSSETMMPAIRYAGRLAGEIPGSLPQTEASLIEGTGVQVGSSRWGDYSAMTVDPVDECTFWYTQEYYATTSSNWQTRIGSFRFPSCGQPKGWISGTVQDANSLVAISGVHVTATGPDTSLTVQTDALGTYTMTLPAGTYTLTAGPLLPGYPVAEVMPGTVVTTGLVTPLDLFLSPQAHLVEEMVWIDDNVAHGNGNGYPEPGESGLLLWETLTNTGATTATNITAHLTALTPGVTVTGADAAYPDIPAGTAAANLTAFQFTIAPTVPCGTVLDFQKVISTGQDVYTVTFGLDAKIPLPPLPLFEDDMESGEGNWTTGGTLERWEITTETFHSAAHAWSDSPNTNYGNNVNAWLRSPVFDLSGKKSIQLDFWHRYGLEIGFDFGYLEYSLNGGSSWQPAVSSYSGQAAWTQATFALPVLDDQPNAAFRFRMYSDGGVTEDGWYIDDVELSYEPFECTFPLAPPGVPTLLAPPDGTITTTQHLTFTWQAGGGEAPEGYNLEVDGLTLTTTATTSPTVLATGTYSWRVRAFNAFGYSAYSADWAVTVEMESYRYYLPIVLRGQ